MSLQALAVACMAMEQLPPYEDEEFGLMTPDEPELDVQWVIYDSMGAGRLLRVRSVAWA